MKVKAASKNHQSRPTEPAFREMVYDIVAHIPRGKVMTYGQIASLAGRPRAARIVGGIAHWGNSEMPWQRVVKKDGSLAEGFPGGISGHQRALETEGVGIKEGKVRMAEHLWQPKYL